jgi:transcriptional regulator with XRE-family HTH domain
LETAVAFGIALRRARKRANLTQEKLGLDADVGRVYVSLVELGQSQPTVGTVFKLCSALGCTPADLMRETAELLESGEATDD